MKHVERPSSRSVVAWVALLSAGTGTALAQVAPGGGKPIPPPDDHMTPDPFPEPTQPSWPDTIGPWPDRAAPPNPTTDDADANQPPVVASPPRDETTVAMAAPAPEERPWLARHGVALSLGGGVSQFTDDGMRETAGTSGFWDLRGHFGTYSLVGFEMAYIGSASSIDPRLGPARDASLLANGAEAVARFNILPAASLQPYLFGGVAWKRYQVAGEDFTTSATGISDQDDVLEIPVGVGGSYRTRGLFLDARFNFRGALDEDLVVGTPDDEADDDFLSDDDAFLPMHNWQLGARVGYEF